MNLIEFLESEGYTEIREIEGRGLCGLKHFMFTTGLVYGMTKIEYEGRYCFERFSDAKEALNNWDGKGDPTGPWIKHKGSVEYSNPNLNEVE